jgi:hypothetical protein
MIVFNLVDRYEQHLRAILGWPLGDSSLTVGAAIMLNVLGEADGADGMRRAHRLVGRAFEVRPVPACDHVAVSALPVLYTVSHCTRPECLSFKLGRGRHSPMWFNAQH